MSDLSNEQALGTALSDAARNAGDDVATDTATRSDAPKAKSRRKTRAVSRYFGGNGGFRSPEAEEDVDPMSSLGNIGDIMLVFACGLMVALVLAWKVDLGQFAQVDLGSEETIDEPEVAEEVLEGGGSTYIERGVVYQDAETGEFYMVESQ